MDGKICLGSLKFTPQNHIYKANRQLFSVLWFPYMHVNSAIIIKYVHRYNMFRIVLGTVDFCFLVMMPTVLTKLLTHTEKMR